MANMNVLWLYTKLLLESEYLLVKFLLPSLPVVLYVGVVVIIVMQDPIWQLHHLQKNQVHNLLHSTSSSSSSLSFGFGNSFRARMSSEPLPPLPEQRTVVGLPPSLPSSLCVCVCVCVFVSLGGLNCDVLIDDDELKQVQGGGNSGNALTCVARLGLSPRLISKVHIVLNTFLVHV
ncbi:hypothetical protein CRG98_043526 [Punica granatum]|uniref:Carbohydrate kinase PfkB domain-containing protein n=1 Tax=Punica granatum TaxID=22663 RepID=A0A2I0HWH3_PUNGR|nr:hypothetical protein CRG98_043526 [Punica granatum]